MHAYCPHGVTRGARCRHCLNGNDAAAPATRPAVATNGRQMGHVPTESLNARQIGADSLPAVKAALLELLAERPMTDDELFVAYITAMHPRRSRQRIGTARAELTKAGRVRDTGERRPSTMGNPARVWEVTPT